MEFYRAENNCQDFLIFFLTSLCFFCKFPKAPQFSEGILRNAPAVCLYGIVPVMKPVSANNLK